MISVEIAVVNCVPVKRTELGHNTVELLWRRVIFVQINLVEVEASN
jgi:hypothetical protein